MAWAVGLGVLLWVPPLIDQLTNEPGNFRELIDHFGSPPEPAVGLGDGIVLALRHLDVWAGIGGQFVESTPFISSASPWSGALTLAVWVVAAAVAWRIGSRALRSLHTVIAVALVLGVISMARIFGRPWFYLTLWAWGVTVVLVGSVVWTALAWWKHRSTTAPGELVGRVAIAAGAVAVLATFASTIDFAGADHPEERLSDAVGALAAPTYEAVVDRVGAATGEDGSYVVRWSDAADIGSPGFGLLDELERRGLDVAADEFFHVPVTDHRTRPRGRSRRPDPSRDGWLRRHLAGGGRGRRGGHLRPSYGPTA